MWGVYSTTPGPEQIIWIEMRWLQSPESDGAVNYLDASCNGKLVDGEEE